MFGGANADYLMENIPYKELVARRDAYIKRRQKEIEEEQKYREQELKEQERAAARNKILR